MRIALAEREAQLMDVLWDHGPSTVAEVQSHLKDELAYTTVLTMLRKLEASAKLQINSIQAISAAVEAGLGCAIATTLFMRERIREGSIHARPIIEPDLSRTLCLCRRSDRPATFVMEAMRKLILSLLQAEIAAGRWEVKPLF